MIRVGLQASGARSGPGVATPVVHWRAPRSCAALVHWRAPAPFAQIGSVNPILVMLLIPTFSGLPPLRRDGTCHWRGLYALAEQCTGLRLTPLRKIGLGLFVTVPGFGISILVEWCAATRAASTPDRSTHTRRWAPPRAR